MSFKNYFLDLYLDIFLLVEDQLVMMPFEYFFNGMKVLRWINRIGITRNFLLANPLFSNK